ncbi:nucleoside-diphosphate-sugar epimerase [Melanomma pulvis-pyrius CBS 109.77]|uniref:Nucleoside-diphosphate-sugar epimerase n=1 Tax=Melanomma pulvis-pyrius CBS 109.77 TaxID=1314802 RepID=A0A6A6WZM4_9PLEO|nr:nucleoside-diphosphate-sugar epimerase [Melanomma pulvis-pyrius CBS 109.77]
MTKLFIIGITGYVGGDTVYAFTQANPEWEITALVRCIDKGAVVAKEYPAIKLVYGDLDNSDLLANESSKVDIVLQLANADHIGSIQAILAGLQRSHTRDAPGYFIHMSGAASLFPASILRDPSQLGTLPADTHIYDDWDGRVDLYKFTPPNAYHKRADLAVTHAEQHVNGAVRCAIVSPPAIYGTGRGPCHRHSMIGPCRARVILTEGAGCLLGDGSNIWNVVHVSDVSVLLALLVEAAIQGGGKADWGHDAYYLCEAGEMTQRELVEPMAKEAARMGLIASPELKAITRERANEIMSFADVLMGSTSRGRSIRARERLGWVPKGRSWAEELPDLLEAVAREMGLWKGGV